MRRMVLHASDRANGADAPGEILVVAVQLSLIGEVDVRRHVGRLLRRGYSALSAWVGGMCAARRAGMYVAIIVTASRDGTTTA